MPQTIRDRFPALLSRIENYNRQGLCEICVEQPSKLIVNFPKIAKIFQIKEICPDCYISYYLPTVESFRK